METKELVLDAALQLFAEKGFHAASVRDIAEQIGIKDSSLYFHYKNKQAILDALLIRFISTSEQMMSFMDEAVSSITSMDDDLFCRVTDQYVQMYLLNDFISKFIRVMNHEQSQNEQLRTQYINWCIKKPIEFQGKIINKLQKIGYLKKSDTYHMTLEYYAPIFLYFNQYMNHDCADEDKEAFQEAVITAAKNFLTVYKKESTA